LCKKHPALTHICNAHDISRTKHSSFSTAFPIYLFSQIPTEVPDEDAITDAPETPAESTPDASETPKASASAEVDEEEAIVEEETSEDEDKPVDEVKPKMKTVIVDEWVQANPQPPIWMRDPKEVTEDEYKTFYHSTFKDYDAPLAWHHFSGDSGTGTSFRAIIYVPGHL
jgi:heat shock protein beta